MTKRMIWYASESRLLRSPTMFRYGKDSLFTNSQPSLFKECITIDHWICYRLVFSEGNYFFFIAAMPYYHIVFIKLLYVTIKYSSVLSIESLKDSLADAVKGRMFRNIKAEATVITMAAENQAS